MSLSDVATLANLIAKDGAVPLLVLNIFVLTIGAHRGWWVPGKQFAKLEKRCDRWQQLALQALTDADKSVSLAEFFREVAGDG